MDSVQKLKRELKALSATPNVDEYRKLENTTENCFRDLLSSYTQVLDASAEGLGMPNATIMYKMNEKSSLKSEEFRMSGNVLFRKEKHDLQDHKMILHFYTKAIAYAPPNSEALALGYSNRSALWLHVQKYDLCLRDIKRALQITASEGLKEKLISRQKKCLDLHEGVKKDCIKLKLPILKPSKLVPCAAESIALTYNEKYGRHYIATRDLRPGEIILIEESPYIAVNHYQKYLICSHCLAFAWAGIPCEFCVYTVYCSETCKKEAWHLYHENTCPRLPLLQSVAEVSKDLFLFVDMSTRIIDIFVKKEGVETMLKEAAMIDKRKGLVGAETYLREDNLDCRKFRSLYGLSNCKIIDHAQPPSLSTIRDKLSYIQKNGNSTKFVAAPIGSNDGPECYHCKDLESCLRNNCVARGAIIGPCCSFMNHSCYPNVASAFLPGPKIVMITQRPVKKGEQLFISYGPRADVESESRESRQDKLLKNYYFVCDCEGCSHNWPDLRPQKKSNKTKKILEDGLTKTFGKYIRNPFMPVTEPTKDWIYSEDLLKASVKMIEYIYHHFHGYEAFALSSTIKYYLRRCFSHLYGEKSNDFPNTC
ncbi:hypothetical protein QAD02_014675 [Eretmocerus hayati]|uniref:Uncharacterized protein n=1 Tax=Eretmocerus hayati TaxID=131215 RepID=A0ACC2P721_9HYME|nr:hypothetical protein QAD02_014675 [Eretmocerus hayati]